MKYYLTYKDIAGRVRILEVGTREAMIEYLNNGDLITLLVEAGSTVPSSPVLGLVKNT